jgi:hypothetical protein
LKKLKNEGFKLSYCPVPLLECRETDSAITLVVRSGDAGERVVLFRSDRIPRSALFNSKNIEIKKDGRNYAVDLPAFTDQAELTINY